MASILGLIGVWILSFYVIFQKGEHFVSQQRQFLGDRLEDLACRSPGDSGQNATVERVDGEPIGRAIPTAANRHILLDPRGDHFRDVAPADGDALADQFESALLGADLFG